MDTFKASAYTACILALIFSFLKEMLPTNKFSKQLSILFSLMLVTAVIRPIANSDLDISFELSSGEISSDYEDKLENRLITDIQENICDSLRELMNENDIFPIKIMIDINNLPDGSISIEQAEITVPEHTDTEKAQKLTADALGECRIKIIKTENKEITEE